VRELGKRYGLVERSHVGLIGRTELATLFFAFCADRYLEERGTLAFIMPRSILTGAKQHARFQGRYLAEAALLIDCEQVEPLFRMPACVVFWTNRVEGSSNGSVTAIPQVALSGRLRSRNTSYQEAMAKLAQSESTHAARTGNERSPYWSSIIQGADIVPRNFW